MSLSLIPACPVPIPDLSCPLQAIGQLLWETPPWKGVTPPQWEGPAGSSQGLQTHPLEESKRWATQGGARWGGFGQACQEGMVNMHRER